VSRDWDAATYDRIADPQFEWAREQLERLELRGDEVVLDAGCGSGRVTKLLLERVPRGRVYGVDIAPSMVEHARAALDGRATVLQQDLVELDLPEPVDAIFSNATFHWVRDHDALFGALSRALAPGGRLVAQCGGRGNIDAFRTVADEVAGDERFARFCTGWRRPWNYATAEETSVRLERAGFGDVSCWLEPKPVEPAEPAAFVTTVCLVRHLDPLPDGLRRPFVDRVLARAGAGRLGRGPSKRGRMPSGPQARALVLEYVRLNMTARKR
jgi:trans-aconitate 2-methyltransferase